MQVREQKVPPQMYGPGPPGVLHERDQKMPPQMYGQVPPGVLHERDQKMAPQMYGPGPPGVLYERPHTLRDYGQVAAIQYNKLHYTTDNTLELLHYTTAT